MSTRRPAERLSDRLFDRYVVADWSAASTPKTGADSIWIAVLDHATAGDPQLINPPTRRLACHELTEACGPDRRTLLAVDAPLGYPAGTADLFGLAGGPVPWRAMWRHVADHLHDDDRNRNDRFDVAAGLNRRVAGDGPFWGRPATSVHEGLATTKPAVFPVPEYRGCERRLRAARRRPASCWQLMGAGSVGSQTLTLLPVLERLADTRPVEVWPFTTGLRAPVVEPGTVVMAETWPTAFEPDLPIHWIRDAAQVHAVARELRSADLAGRLAGWFVPHLPVADVAAIESEEGWVLMPTPDEAADVLGR